MITGVNIARTPDRSDCMKNNIISREIYLPIADVVVGGGDADDDDEGTRSEVVNERR